MQLIPFINVPGKLSGPAAFLVFIFFKTFSTSDDETSQKLNILPLGFKDSALVEGLYTFQQVLISDFDIDFLSEVDFPFTLMLVIEVDLVFEGNTFLICFQKSLGRSIFSWNTFSKY